MKIELTKKHGIIALIVFIVLGIFTATVKDPEEAKNKDGASEKDSLTFAHLKGDEDRSEGDGKEQVVMKDALEGDPYKELDELIGLKSVKQEVHTLANFVKVQKMRADKGLKTPKLSYHIVFTGSPGTGKTTVARIVARIYKDLGILKKGHLVETDRSGMIGQYVGQTAPRVNAICDSALNGVLFIDEAYALTQSENGNDYGAEAVATLLKRMEDDRDKLVVIVAGYSNEMKKFINSNPGLESRFNRYIHFPDYTADELYQIFRMYMDKNEYTITKEAATYLQQRLEYVVQHKDRNFGNARYVRNVFEKVIQVQANRLTTTSKVSDRDLTEITLNDVKAVL